MRTGSAIHLVNNFMAELDQTVDRSRKFFRCFRIDHSSYSFCALGFVINRHAASALKIPGTNPSNQSFEG